MKKIKLTIEFDGTDYVGWQHQANGYSVQEAIEAALAKVLSQPVVIFSSGRTDAGVHARGMVAHFETEANLPLTAYREGVNSLLPRDIAIVDVEEVAADFHARYSALAKRYRYSLSLGEIRSPLANRYSWQINKPLDVDAMRKAAASLVGHHDFSAFRSSGCNAKTTIREIFSVEIKKHGRMLHVDIIGSGFLRNMVRVIAGTLVDVGRGKRHYSEVSKLLESGQRDFSVVTAPSQGLCLMQVWYEGDLAQWTASAKPCKSCQKSLDK
jgi:tRNA pseudouridine38-40 synthase